MVEQKTAIKCVRCRWPFWVDPDDSLLQSEAPLCPDCAGLLDQVRAYLEQVGEKA